MSKPKASDVFFAQVGKLTIREVEAQFESSEIHGADIRFHGVVRNFEDARPIKGIRYSFYEGMAEKQLNAIGLKMTDEFPDHRAFVYHRVGEVAAGEASILIRVFSGTAANCRASSVGV